MVSAAFFLTLLTKIYVNFAEKTATRRRFIIKQAQGTKGIGGSWSLKSRAAKELRKQKKIYRTHKLREERVPRRIGIKTARNRKNGQILMTKNRNGRNKIRKRWKERSESHRNVWIAHGNENKI